MAPHVEDARDRLVAMNRTVPEPTQAAIAESDAEERSRQPLHFTDNMLGVIKRGPTVVEAVHVGEPTLDDPKRTLAPEVTNQNKAVFMDAMNQGKPSAPAAAVTPTGPNEPPRSDQPSTAPLQMQAPGEGTGVGVEVVNAPSISSSRSAPPIPFCPLQKNPPKRPSRSTTSSPARTRLNRRPKLLPMAKPRNPKST
jgi:outer membrane protein assembly factor BamD